MRRGLLFAAVLLLCAPSWAAERIVLASTTSVENSGLLQHILPVFTAGTGITVHVLALGTGQALAVASRGDADLVLTHDRDAEQRFMAAGHGTEQRDVAWNDFVIIGPERDPAHIAGRQDAVDALQAIRHAGAAFVSRGDGSGTDAMEKRLWRAGSHVPLGSPWYKQIGAGMGAALNTAAAIGAYTLSDRGTWLTFNNKRDLKVLVEDGKALLNVYSVMLLNPATHGSEGQAPARALADWLVSPAGQAAIASYTVSGVPLFHPNADPKP